MRIVAWMAVFAGIIMGVSTLGTPDAQAEDVPSVAPTSASLAWDGKESIADYAKRTGLKATETLDLGDGVNIEFLLVPAGSFLMGSPATEDRRPQDADSEKLHKVTLTKPFYLAKFELSQAQYEKIIGANPSSAKGPSLAVTDITWGEADAFCKKAGETLKRDIRLPSEAQWEFACRAGTQTAYYTGDGEAALDKAGWHGKNSERHLHSSGEKAPNAFGFYDMLGNVREFCADNFENYDGADAVDPTGPATAEKRVSRGGAYAAQMIQICRCASRTPEPLTRKNSIIGIRPLLIPAGLEIVRTAQSGAWSDPKTWENGKLPAAGNAVQIREGHDVLYDLESSQALRSIYISGQLRFAHDRNTRLDVGLIKIQGGNDTTEHGFNCTAKLAPPDPKKSRAALEVGTAAQPIDAAYTATIRLVFFDGMDPQSSPAIVCCGGRMDFHGAEMNRTWLKLGDDAKKGSSEITLAEAVSGWRTGDHIIVVGNVRQNKIQKTFVHPPGGVRDRTQTEERTVAAVDGNKLRLNAPLEFDHAGTGEFRSEVANLSRNVIVESADPEKQRGHTMYHRYSAGSISYAEFRHLGKADVLGRYSLHFHLVGDTMRGSSVIGASIWDSANRWITIHGTNFLVVRDCVGYNSIGHGYFLEDGTEQFNVLDRNLAVQARHGNAMPDQVLPFDHNDGAGFWWGNCMNTFTRNVAAECDEYGFRFDMAKTEKFDPVLPVQQLDGSSAQIDVRKLQYVRFEENEAHTQRRHAFNLGGFGAGSDQNINAPDAQKKCGVAGVGPDEKHPLVLKNCRAWDVHWSLHSLSPWLVVDQFSALNAEYGLWRSPTEHHIYHAMKFKDVKEENFSGEGKTRDAGLPKDVDPATLGLVDDMPPQTIITDVSVQKTGKLRVRGTTADNGPVKQVLINGGAATAVSANFAEWEIVCDDPRPGKMTLTACAEDAAGNVEKIPHVLTLPEPGLSASTELPPPAAGSPAPAPVTTRAEPTTGTEVEWSMEVGCQHCHYSEETGIKTCVANCGAAGKYNGKVYFLKGNTTKEFGKGGVWAVKGALSADGKTVQVSEMKMTALALPDATEPKASSVAPAELKPAQTWSGVVFHTGKFLPSLTVGADKFGLKPARDATSEVKSTLTRIGGGELTGAFTVRGTSYKDDARTWIVVESVTQAPAPEPVAQPAAAGVTQQ